MAPLRRRLQLVATLLCALLLALVAPLGHPALALAAPIDASAAVAEVTPGLVQITTRVDFQGVVGNGTGIVLTPDGQVLTNRHVVQGANDITAISMGNGRSYTADVLGYDRNEDVALLQLRGASGLPVAPIGDSNTLQQGQPVVTIGNANGTGNPLTHEQGTVTSLNRSIDAEDELTGSKFNLGGLIESSTNLRAGDSGGALVNAEGEIVGMNAAATLNFKMNGESTPGGAGFAIPINKAIDIANQIRNGAASDVVHLGPSAMLGVGISADGASDSGLEVKSVLRGGPADLAGLRPGDTIASVDGTPINSTNQLTGLLDQRYPGAVIDLNWIDANGVGRNAKVTLESGPVS
ncbi:MAG: trypsin-like peptidase domain-containing protein [Mycobacterium sp.]|nr:trypsin-like peptidase domain-containing protein [Mycobacterium sp.]